MRAGARSTPGGRACTSSFNSRRCGWSSGSMSVLDRLNRRLLDFKYDVRLAATRIDAGGLAAAIRLGARGYRVTVLEQLDAPGGRAYVYRQDGFTFDAGPTIVTAPFLFEELWSLCGRRFADDVELRALHPFYRIRYDDGSILDCSADDAHMDEQIQRFAPRDLEGYRRFLEASEAIYRVAFERLGAQPFGSFTDMLRLAPELLRLRSYRTIHGLVAGFVRDPKLRFALSFHPLFVGGNPFRTTSIYGLIAFLERRFGGTLPRPGAAGRGAPLVAPPARPGEILDEPV